MKIRYLIPMAALTLLAACKQKPAETAPAAAAVAAPVATVNGAAISADLLETYVKAAAGRNLSELSAEQKNEAIDSLVRMQLLAEQADKQGVTKDKSTIALVELSKLEVLQRTVTANYVKGKEPTEQELRAEYDAQMAAAPRTEYHVRHILVQSEEFANTLIGRLQKGARFEQLASQESADAQSKPRGGDLSWVSPASSLPPPFIQAMLGLKKGAFTTTPVKTQFGFHIIKVDDTREATLPAFDQPEVKQKLAQIVLTKKVKAYTDELLKTAKVERK
jgi:peptidyl-prolyl cis-trans isomerase C